MGPEIAALDARIRAAEAEMSRRVSEWLFPAFIGPPERPQPIPWRTRARWWWYGVRVWIAEKVLRIDVESGDDW